ncbi:HalOD1 output domain-containing protein [Halorussus halobius]|uniref:HalOD1 output domain-containing protein n=1 Tax=Halorussus halobius TaxID=1710537 RepID=UPI0010918A3C|nr:HalOD1 output domain-containing protein [Halorussus halobius]
MSENHPRLRRETALTYEVPDDQTLSEGVVAAVADASEADPTRLAPLARTVDPEALDALFGDRYDGTARADGVVRFSFCGYEVVACGDGWVSVLGADG